MTGVRQNDAEEEAARPSEQSLKDARAPAAYLIRNAVPSREDNHTPVPEAKPGATTTGAMPAYGALTSDLGRLTPTNPGRIKSPPVCSNPSLKKEASSAVDLGLPGVCFTEHEAENAAGRALATQGGSGSDDECPLAVEKSDSQFAWTIQAESAEAAREVKAYVSCGSTIVTTSTSGGSCAGPSSSGSFCGAGEAIAALKTAAGGIVSSSPPVEVVRTDEAAEVPTTDDEGLCATGGGRRSGTLCSSALGGGDGKLGGNSSRAVTTTAPLSSSFTSKLQSQSSSRQGRSLQRWLVHSRTDELVRQVAGCIPITQDGRVILVSASRKAEWILPKGGWDADETKEECAARETYEEAGLIGRLGGCLDPIDYETNKAKKRRLDQISGGTAAFSRKGRDSTGSSEEGKRASKCPKVEDRIIAPPPFPNRVTTAARSPATACPDTDSKKPPGPSPVSSLTETSPSTTASAATPADASLDPTKYSFVRMFLFPLYVTSVQEEWPERGRLRKLVSIDEAIEIMGSENRKYFKRGLEMIKERGLHVPRG